MIRILGTALAALLLATPLAASAQEIPSYADAPQVAQADEQIRGRIASFDGAYNLTVNDERGFVDNVDLHDGTIINPTGLTLAPGMIVSILGYNDGSQFSANEIDTPYSYDSGVPYYAGHPWDYYGANINLTFFFGNLGWWHGNAFQGAYGYNGGARHYDNVNVSNIVRDSYVQHRGEAYRASGKVVAPRENVATSNRPVAPVQSQVTQQRNYGSEPRQAIARQPIAAQTVVANRPVVRLPVPSQPVARPPVMRQPVVHQPTLSQVVNRQSSPRESAPRAQSSHDRGGRAR
jgi:hypothetical protein